jgi:hypothetical protein
MKASPGAMACIVLFLGATLVAPFSANAQTPPTYPELFVNPPQTEQLTQADLPNLSRIVVLESIAMFSNVTSELYEIREDNRLQNLIRVLWYAADQFNAAVSLYPTLTEGVAAGRLTFPDVATAFDEIRGTLGRMPGTAPRTAVNFTNLSRVIAVIGPLLDQAPPSSNTAAATGEPPSGLDDLRIQAQEIARELASLQDRLKKPPAPPSASREIEPQLDMLAQLIQGFGRVVRGEPGEREAAASFRPIRSRAEEVHRAISRSDLPVALKSQWRAIYNMIDDAAAGFELPRQIVVRRRDVAAAASASQAASSTGAIIRDIDSAVDRLSREAARLSDNSALADDVHELQIRLVVLRQQVLGREPEPRIRQTFGEVEMARRLLAERSRPIVQGRPQASDSLNRDIEAAIAQIRGLLFKSR